MRTVGGIARVRCCRQAPRWRFICWPSRPGRSATWIAPTVSSFPNGRFLIDVFEEWVRHDVGRVYVQMFDVALANWYGAPPGLCVHSETCGLALALEHTGDLYSCGRQARPQRVMSVRLGPEMEKVPRRPRQPPRPPGQDSGKVTGKATRALFSAFPCDRQGACGTRGRRFLMGSP